MFHSPAANSTAEADRPTRTVPSTVPVGLPVGHPHLQPPDEFHNAGPDVYWPADHRICHEDDPLRVDELQ